MHVAIPPPTHFREDLEIFCINFKNRELIKSYIQIESKNLVGTWDLRGELNNLPGIRNPFFITFEHFCLVSKLKIEIIDVKHQVLSLVVWLELHRLKNLKALWKIVKIFKSSSSIQVFIQAFKDKDLCCWKN